MSLIEVAEKGLTVKREYPNVSPNSTGLELAIMTAPLLLSQIKSAFDNDLARMARMMGDVG